MTESNTQPAEAEVPEQAAPCRHCGQPAPDGAEAGSDWLCPACEHYQDLMLCPTCNQPVRISLMPAEMAPEPAAPRRKKSGD